MGRRFIDVEVQKFYAQQTLKWCKKYLGHNLRKRKPIKLSVLKNPKNLDDKNDCGSYHSHENRIIIYYVNCPTIKEIVSTVIHEYTHYLQSNKQYYEFTEYYNYFSHPFEVEARKNEELYTNRCVRYIKRYLL